MTLEEKRKYHREYNKKWRENPEVKKKEKEYRESESVKKKTKERIKNWRKSITGKKSRVISTWKFNGIKDEDFESLYEAYLNESNCWICGHDFYKYKKCLDHDHRTGEVRYICCHMCNSTILNSNITNQFVKIIFEEY
jgi:hypothetical protein